MPLTRREVLKFAAAAPFLYRKLAGSPFPAAFQDHAHILLRGLFFMEYQSNNQLFVIAAPKHDKHCFFYRDDVTPHHRGQHVPLPNKLSAMGGVLKAGSLPSGDPFSPEILHFSCTDIRQNGYLIDSSNPSQYAFVWGLPYPKFVIPLRCGSYDGFNPNNGYVARSIKNHCAGRIATVVWLGYDVVDPTKPPSFLVRTLYAEHGYDPTIPDVNCALKDATGVFPQFDLTLGPGTSNVVPEDSQSQLPSDIDPRDEDALTEVDSNPCSITAHCGLQGQTLEVANCPIFGVMP